MTTTPIGCAVPLIPRQVLFGNPDLLNPALSPDGTWIGYAAPDEGVLNLVIEPLDGSASPRVITRDRHRGIKAFVWCHDGKHLVYQQDTDGDESYRLHRVDRHSGEARLLTPRHGVRARILAHNQWHPEVMLVALAADDAVLTDVYLLRIATGELTKIESNPGSAGGPPFAGWLVDTELTVRGGMTMTPDGRLAFMIRDAAGEYRRVIDIPADDVDSRTSAWFRRDGRTLLMSTSYGAETKRLVTLDVETGEMATLAEDPEFDLAGVWRDHQTREPLVAVFARDRLGYVPLDASAAVDLARVRALDGGDIVLAGTAKRGRMWLVASTVPDAPVRYYLYDRDTGAARLLFVGNSALAGYRLAKTEPFSFRARDGLLIHGYVTTPPGVTRAQLPAVLLVHGGPWDRDRWSYNPRVQWLANRGYACVQVNYRGSIGYGKAFSRAGDRQWGRAMQDDLVDAVRHVIEQGWVDPDRIAIYGGSYGGYAALCGCAFTPQLFRCAVDMCGPANLITLIESLPARARSMIAYYHTRVGNPDTDRDMLWQSSPLSRVDQITVPVLIAQGANDRRVPESEAGQIVEALTRHGVPHHYLRYDDEGHGLARPENRERFYAAVEAFLAEHLGGRCQEQMSGAADHVARGDF